MLVSGKQGQVRGKTRVRGILSDSSLRLQGGAISSSDFTVTVSTCLFFDNILSTPPGAEASGGAVSMGSATTFTNCTFRSNTANNTAAGSGGAIFQRDDARAGILTDCYFISNSAGTSGGAIVPGVLGTVSLTGSNLFFCGNAVNGALNDFSCIASLAPAVPISLAPSSGFACGFSTGTTCNVVALTASTTDCSTPGVGIPVASCSISPPAATPADAIAPGL
jgi:hypothetical protein